MSEYEAAMVTVLTQIAVHLGTLAGIAQRWEASADAASLSTIATALGVLTQRVERLTDTLEDDL
jgi:hypothetical protein